MKIPVSLPVRSVGLIVPLSTPPCGKSIAIDLGIFYAAIASLVEVREQGTAANGGVMDVQSINIHASYTYMSAVCNIDCHGRIGGL